MKALLCSSALVLAAAAQAQNLVPNGSFEDYTACPTNAFQINRAVGWSTVSHTPDYFNECCITDTVAVPWNFAGFQHPYEGQGYAGLITYLEGAPYRECIQHVLSQPLIPGEAVHISMMVSPGAFGRYPNSNMRYASNGIGMKFSMQAHTTPDIWPGNVAMYYTNVLSDTAAWQQVSAIYVPDSAYQFVVIGCFFEDVQLATAVLDPNGQETGAYAFVDAVCVSMTPVECGMQSSINEHLQAAMVLGDNPFGDELVLRANTPIDHSCTIRLTDMLGQQVWQGAWTYGQREMHIDVHFLSPGAYLLSTSQVPYTSPSRMVLHLSP